VATHGSPRAAARTVARRRPPASRRKGLRGRRRRIVTITAPDAGVLRSRSAQVRSIDGGIRRLIADMQTTMRSAHGVGLAAPQIGVPLRVLVAEVGRRPLALVNPRLRRRVGRQVGPEGCLSIPGVYADVRRAMRVVVDGRTAGGRRVSVRASGLLARILQHEIDHLNGVLFIDRTAPRRIMERPMPAAADEVRQAGRNGQSPEHAVPTVSAAAARRYRRALPALG
jgi:peptide deformylase